VSGLLRGGAARVVASRWNVESRSSALFMNRFYAEMLGGSGVADALQKAAGQLRGRNETKHPYFWAAFQDFGTR
jgi:CHAT domain-containing protein